MNRLETGGCGCCTSLYVVEVTETAVMPDGKTIFRLKDRDSEKTWWYDTDMETHWEADEVKRWNEVKSD